MLAGSVLRRGLRTVVRELKVEKAAPLAALKNDGVLIKMVAAPIHQADMTGAGTGMEGLGVVSEVGPGVKSLREGDWVVPPLGFGAWCEEAVVCENTVTPVPNDIPASYAANLSVDCATAYRLLRDFENLSPGDYILQSNASSSVGVAVIQMAREMGIKTINVVDSNTPDVESVLLLLSNLGGDINISETYLNSAEFNAVTAEIPACKLALNSASGTVVANMTRVLAQNGSLVTYGLNSASPEGNAMVPYEVLAYQNIKMKTFSIEKWYLLNSQAKRMEMNTEIVDLIRQHKLNLFFQEHDFDDFAYALSCSQQQAAGPQRKVVLRMDHGDRLAEHDTKSDQEYEVFETTLV
jgi:mitochondrial enoyl-[acyl-carrier protein] reductase / trans-2-enoyl-CoA reductase